MSDMNNIPIALVQLYKYLRYLACFPISTLQLTFHPASLSIAMSLPFPNERLPFAQLSFQGLVDMYRRATRNYNESNQQVPDLEQYINAVLCGRWPRPAEVRMSLNIRQGLTAPDVDDATITRDLDSLIGISDRLPYTGKLAVFPVPSFRDTLCKDVGIRGNAFVGVCHLIAQIERSIDFSLVA